MKIKKYGLTSFFLFLIFYYLPDAKSLDTLIIEGLNNYPENSVRHTVGLRKNQNFSSVDIQDAIKRLYEIGLFRNIDFYVISETDSSASLQLVLTEFPACENIEYEGNKKLKKKELEEKSTIKKDQILTDAAIFDEKTRIIKLYEEKGYNLVEVIPKLIPTKIPGRAILKFVISEGARIKVKKIVFKGNKDIKTSKLLWNFKTKESRWWRSGDFKREEYKKHLDSLILFYNDQGYLDAAIVKDSVWLMENKKDIMIEITIDEGKKYYTGEFFFKGNRIIPTDSLQKRIALRNGKPFSKNLFELSRYLIENTYREEGYLWVQVSDERSYRGDTIDVTFNVYEGRAAVVRKIDIKGNTKTMEKVVRRELDLIPGKKYKQSKMLRSRQRILALNFFSDVKPDLIPNDDGTIDLIFDITESENIGQLHVGAAYSQYNGFIGTFSMAIPNFRGTGEEVGLSIEYGKDYKNFSLNFKEPWAFDRPIEMKGSIFYIDHSYYTYYANKQYGFTLGSGLTKMSWPDDHFTFSSEYQFSYEEGREGYASDMLRPEFGLNVLRKGFTSKISFNLVRYDLDMPMFPSEGSRLYISPQFTGLGGTYRYIKGIVGYEHYFPLKWNLVFGTRVKGGLITSYPGTDIKISKFELFKLGGVYWSDADLRGYKEFQFGGMAEPGTRDYGKPENGLTLLASTVELRYPLLEQQLYIGIFADAANTWSSISKINPLELNKSIGAGIRINIPMMGLMGFDFGYGFDDPTPDGFERKPSGWNWSFMMNRGF